MKNIYKNFSLPIENEQLINLEKFTNKFSNIQKAWLSGYFWALSNQNEQHDNNDETLLQAPIVTILTASQTGNARSLSMLLHDHFSKHNIKSNMINASDYQFKKINKEKFLIIITSTQGEGEPPEEALPFYNFLMSNKAPKINDLYYSVFSLGDSSYEFFCQAGKDFDNKIHELGGIRLIDRVDADIDYTVIAGKWREDLSKNLKKIFKKYNNIEFRDVLKENNNNNIILYTKKRPFHATLLVNQKITGRNSIKDIRHIEINLDDSNISYKPGDALGIWYENDSQLVMELLDLLHIPLSTEIIKEEKKIKIFDVLKNNFELTVNTTNIVKSYAALSHNKILQSIILDKKKLQSYVVHTPIIDMIKSSPIEIDCKQLLNILRPLTPRLYSISSSQLEIENEVHITVALVQYFMNNRLHVGGASGYLSHRLKENENVKIFIENNNNFRLPNDNSMPIIMIGAGTGIAPFRAFMQHRDNENAKGKNWLFFGNQSFTEDFLYHIEWKRYYEKKLLTKIDLAWSRDQKEKIYIQDKIKSQGPEIWNWINEGVYIYVCGDALNMAKDVELALLQVLIDHANMSLEQAEEFFNNLRIQKRYQRDIY
ncbi:MAG TPA: NADPH-dependent assimilatory sulfite reductase flavoprotein subunit [Buchnera sp. (in: enterobacteria)]|nr:NADPH-dependent assimilatory sulfite reductase flavoprotein subunit [Buchnera sp. (in: enterobacteria)]